MISKSLSFLFVLFSFLFIHTSSYAAETDFASAIQSSSIFVPENIFLGEELVLDIKDIDTRLQELSETSSNFYYRWDIYNRSPLEDGTQSVSFNSYGEKKISLNIYDNEKDQTLLYSKDYSIFVYQHSLPLLLSNNVDSTEIDLFYKNAKNAGVYIYNIGIYNEDELNGKNIVSELEIYKKGNKGLSNYLHIWGEKEFLLSTISQIGTQSRELTIKNFVLTSSYNANILQGYLGNSLAGKDFIETAFIIDESSTQRILQNPSDIGDLISDLKKNNYTYTSISDEIKISPFFFISKFINSLSQSGISTSDLYIVLLLPVFLTIVAVSKHLIGISTLGSVIPVFISLLFIKIGIVFTLALMIFLLVCNIGIGLFLNKYTLLYTPKVACITIINMIVFIISYQIGFHYGIISSPVDSVLYIVIFFIIAEKLITIITSKEFREYQKSLSGTIIVALLCTLLYFSNPIVVLLTAYPEVLILLIPFNFFLGRFTGLRITEYLRFREIVKNIEE